MAAIPDPLELKDLRAFPLKEPASGRRYTLLRMETRSGLRGWGECAQASEKDLAQTRQLLAGVPATAYEVAWRKLEALPYLRAAVNMAQLDILGQQTKAPVYQVLGGPTRFKVRAMAPISGDAPSELLASMNAARQAGYRSFSVPVPPAQWRNNGQAYVFSARGRIEILRKNAGPDVDFVLDGGGALAPGDAAAISTEIEKLRLLWFDEPCAVGNLGAIRKLADENVTPLGFGRTLLRGGEFQDLLREEAADILRPDLATHGISYIRRLGALAETYYVAVAPYHNGGPVATAAALHLAASMPNFFIQQIPQAVEADRLMREAIAGPAERVKDGFVSLTNSPGLGLAINEKMLDRYKDKG